jgi:hypothetical protein
MDFLKRLAPAREQEGSRAVAVLPSRFASLRPLRTSRAHWTPAEERTGGERESVALEQFDPVVPSRSDDSLRVVENRMAARDVDVAEPWRIRQGPDPQVREGSDPERNISAPRVDNTEPRATSVAVSARSMPPARTAPMPTRPVPREAPPRAPISAASIAARERTMQGDTTVVHVTIDRIDVRAPSADRLAEQPAKRRKEPPRVSLAEYLRGDRPAGGGSGR